MRLRRRYVGIDINATGLTLAALQRERSMSHIVGIRQESIDNVFEFSSQRPNVRDSRRFVEGLRRGIDLLAPGEEQLALSLPDRTGRIYLTEIETPFKSHQEGVDILKWSLKGSLPADPSQVKLDFQVLEKRDDGRRRCIAAAMALPVLEQYENLIQEAGLQAAAIEFHALSLVNYYQRRYDLGDEFIFVGLEKGVLTFKYYAGKILAYQRVREGALSSQRLFHELNRTLAEVQAEFPATRRCPVQAHVDNDLGDEIEKLLTASFEREVKILDPQFKRQAGPGTLESLPPGGALAAALAAAESLM
ncbi:MAG TPA: hypothetical protein VJ910_07065 [Desulfuromonadales bacterium]|nr:hypothetical protein [Desulfuromonadales bacterium]